MKRQFVLDDNVINCAQSERNVRGGTDDTCLMLIKLIERNCHSIVIADDFWARYSRQVRDLERQRVPVPLGTGVMAILKTILSNSDKGNSVIANSDLIEVPELGGMQGVDVEDAYYVRAAATSSQSVLVTSDGPLTRALLSADLPRKLRFEVMSPMEALDLAAIEEPVVDTAPSRRRGRTGPARRT
jgi:hypothetical protein